MGALAIILRGVATVMDDVHSLWFTFGMAPLVWGIVVLPNYIVAKYAPLDDDNKEHTISQGVPSVLSLSLSCLPLLKRSGVLLSIFQSGEHTAIYKYSHIVSLPYSPFIFEWLFFEWERWKPELPGC